MPTTPLTILTHYYQQFDADFARDVPAEGYGGWKRAELTFPAEHTALAVMHAWDCGTREQFPGWHRCVEYIPRAERIAREVFPPLLAATRAAGLRVYHVVWGPWGGRRTYEELPGYRRAVALAPHEPEPPRIEVDEPAMEAIARFRGDHVFVGRDNRADVERGCRDLRFLPAAEPRGEEGVAESAAQLFGLCRADAVSHLVYIGFAINWCLLMSPGGMLDMSRRGVMCSTIRQAVTAVENKDSARGELAKELALWRVALAFGFVFDDADWIAAAGRLAAAG